MKYLLTGQETERLKFRLLVPEDFDSWINLFKPTNVAKFLKLDPKLSNKRLCELWFEKAFHRYENNLGGMNVLINKKTNELIGQSGILVQNIDNIERLEIGYSILPEFWNKGFASESAIKCKNFAFENNFSESLVSVVHHENIGSERVAIKNGMTLEKKMTSFNVFSIDRIAWDK